MALIPLYEAKTYLRVDSSDEDALIGILLSSAEQMCKDVGRLSEDQWEAVNAADRDAENGVQPTRELEALRSTCRVAILYALGYLYEHRDEADHKQLMLTLRSIGLKNCHYAKATFDEDGGVTYDTPVRIPGAVSLSLDANGEIEPFYADNIAYYVVNNNSGYEGDLEIALIPESFLTDIMHEELDGNGVLAENANAELEHFAFLFEFDGDQRHIRHVMYNCVASRPAVEGDTNEDSKEVKTDKLTLQATPLANGYVKAKTGTNTSDDVYNKWYEKVYEPQSEASSMGTEETDPQG